MRAPEQPDYVANGQMWKDMDRRSVGSGEFTIIAVVTPDAVIHRNPDNVSPQLRWAADKATEKARAGKTYVVASRSTRLSIISKDRMMSGKDYLYIGMSR